MVVMHTFLLYCILPACYSILLILRCTLYTIDDTLYDILQQCVDSVERRKTRSDMHLSYEWNANTQCLIAARGRRNGRQQNGRPQRGRQFDRHSGTGIV